MNYFHANIGGNAPIVCPAIIQQLYRLVLTCEAYALQNIQNSFRISATSILQHFQTQYLREVFF